MAGGGRHAQVHSRGGGGVCSIMRHHLHTCVRRCWRGGLYDCGAIICHAELASSLGVQWGKGGRTRASVPPIGPPRELQIQGLVQGQHDRNPTTSHLTGKMPWIWPRYLRLGPPLPGANFARKVLWLKRRRCQMTPRQCVAFSSISTKYRADAS